MSTTINLTNVIAAKGYGGADLVAIYGQGGVKIWEAGEPDYSKKYLTFVATSDGVFSYKANGQNTISYSTDRGVTWSEPSSEVTVNVNTGDKVMWKGSGTTTGSSLGIGYFGNTNVYNQQTPISTATFDIEGNIMSLLSGDNFVNTDDLTGINYAFNKLFAHTRCVNTSNLILPATTLTQNCYQYLFGFCGSLTTPPELPSTSLANSCYSQMFHACTSLTQAPQLPATTLAQSCYEYMFEGCSALTQAPQLPATTLTQGCYLHMFWKCSSLTQAPELPAIMAVPDHAYYWLFASCTKLNYIKMLSTNITANSCTTKWVNGVAATGIFVKNIDATWTTTGADGVPTGWTLIYFDPATSKYYLQDKVTMCDDHGNPIGKDYSRVPFTIVAKSDGDIVFSRGYYEIPEGEGSGSGSGDGEGTPMSYYYEIEYSTDGGTTWETADPLDSDLTISVQTDDEIMLKFDMCPIIDNPDATWNSLIGMNCFSQSTADFEVQGNIMSLVYGNSFIGETSFPSPDINFTGMFSGCGTLVNAENLILPATTLTNNCYESMFTGCPSLVNAPALPATTLAYSCYMSMFDGCESLTTAPVLPATTLAESCYNGMFNSCTSLTAAPALPATTLADCCYLSMFSGTDLTTAPALPATTLASDCYSNMFSGCGSLTTAPALPVTTLASGCYQNMFSYCGSLTTAPVLPATILTEMCYWNMFSGCESLSHITMLATDISADDCLTDWVDGVAATGTFVKAAAMTSLTTGASGIPNGWSVQDAT